jgi:hypothetical protein
VGGVAYLDAIADCIRFDGAKRPRNFRKMSRFATRYATQKRGRGATIFKLPEENCGCRSKNATLENESGCIRFLMLVTRNGCIANINSIIHPVVKRGAWE